MTYVRREFKLVQVYIVGAHVFWGERYCVSLFYTSIAYRKSATEHPPPSTPWCQFCVSV